MILLKRIIIVHMDDTQISDFVIAIATGIGMLFFFIRSSNRFHHYFVRHVDIQFI